MDDLGMHRMSMNMCWIEHGCDTGSDRFGSRSAQSEPVNIQVYWLINFLKAIFIFIALKNTIKTVRDAGNAVDHSMTYIVPMLTVKKSVPVGSCSRYGKLESLSTNYTE